MLRFDDRYSGAFCSDPTYPSPEAGARGPDTRRSGHAA
jgi:hypothetical protein